MKGGEQLDEGRRAAGWREESSWMEGGEQLDETKTCSLRPAHPPELCCSSSSTQPFLPRPTRPPT